MNDIRNMTFYEFIMVWVPKYRKMILGGELSKRLKMSFFEIDTMELKDDHVHLFLSAPPRYSPAKILQIIKSISAKMVFKQFPEVKKEPLGWRVLE